MGAWATRYAPAIPSNCVFSWRQTEKGEKAKGPTAEEFKKRVMRPLVGKARKIMEDYAHELDNPEDFEPIYSFDGPTIHKKDKLADIGIVEGDNVLPLPPYCGDMQKVIEHVHGTLVKRMHMVQKKVRTRQPAMFWRAQLKHLFWAYEVQSVRRDVESLRDTMDAIRKPQAQGGTGGDYAPRGLN